MINGRERYDESVNNNKFHFTSRRCIESTKHKLKSDHFESV